MTTQEILLQTYGPLMTLSEVARIFDRSPEGLRLTIRSDNALGRQLSSARVKIGRRVHFKATAIATMVDGAVVTA